MTISRLKIDVMIRAMPRRKWAFVASLPPKSVVLDVGCGSRSPLIYKQIRPDIFLVGLDIFALPPRLIGSMGIDSFILTQSENFHASVAQAGPVDAVISSHNLEHVEDPEKVADAMIESLRPGGKLYLSFPSAASTNFPKRRGTLNFFDDPTHKNIMTISWLVKKLSTSMRIVFLAERYRPIIPFCLGALLEPISALSRTVLPGTWALYGFETVVWAEKMTKVGKLPNAEARIVT